MKYVLILILLLVYLFPQYAVKLLSESKQDAVFVTLSSERF